MSSVEAAGVDTSSQTHQLKLTAIDLNDFKQILIPKFTRVSRSY